jgi:hypothetical protein
VQVPTFLRRQTFENWKPGENDVPSGTVISATNAALLQGMNLVGVGVIVADGVGDDVGVVVKVGVAVGST